MKTRIISIIIALVMIFVLLAALLPRSLFSPVSISKTFEELAALIPPPQPALFLLQAYRLVGGPVGGQESVFKLVEGAVPHRFPYFRYQVGHESQVVDGCQAQSEQLLTAEKVVQVGGGKGAAGVAAAGGVDWPLLVPVSGVADVAPSLGGLESAVAGDAGGQGAVKDVDAPGDPFNDILR